MLDHDCKSIYLLSILNHTIQGSHHEMLIYNKNWDMVSFINDVDSWGKKGVGVAKWSFHHISLISLSDREGGLEIPKILTTWFIDDIWPSGFIEKCKAS